MASARWLAFCAVDRILLAVVLVVVAAAAAVLLSRRRPDAPTQPGWTVPAQLDRGDFIEPTKPWLVVVFSSGTCQTCAGVVTEARTLEGPSVAVTEVEVGADPTLHERYDIDAVPTLVVADADGVVRASYVGPVDPADLAGTVSQLWG